ncbi:MAG: DUF2924 domain-containing protein [Pseudomonadota bacterium]
MTVRTCDHIASLDDTELVGSWIEVEGAPPPVAMTPRLQRLALAWAAQATASGGPPTNAARKLQRVLSHSQRTARPLPRPGTSLLRDWQGRTYRVEVMADGSFAHDGRRWRSLSAIARAITGQRRNGPAFFGLREGRRDGC